MRSPNLFCIGKFVIYISSLSRVDSSTAPKVYLNFYSYVCSSYSGVCIDIFVHVIQSTGWLYFILGIFFYISPVHGLLHHYTILTSDFVLIFLWILYLCLLWYVCVPHNIYSLVVVQFGSLVMNFPVYHLLFQYRHTCWPVWKKCINI